MSNLSSIKFYVRISSTDRNIRQWLLLNGAFIISDVTNLLFFRFCQTSKKSTFSVFLSFFLVKLPKSQSLKLNISRTAQPILTILVSFCRILNGLPDEINLFWRCSSPLRPGETGQHCLPNTIVCFCVISYKQSTHVAIRTRTMMFG